ncbi:MAG: nucleoside-triphosphatase [Anaerolineae bacterium]
MGKTLLLTGYPGCGKTTVIRKVVAQLGDRAGGFYTEEITGPGGRKGFRLITLEGKEAVLAHKELRGPRVPRVGRYGVDVKALEEVGVAALRRAREAGRIVVVDEIGKMELYSHAFQLTVMEAVLGPTPVLGTIVKRPHPGAEAFKGLAQVTLWEVEPRNRDALPARILAWLGEV